MCFGGIQGPPKHWKYGRTFCFVAHTYIKLSFRMETSYARYLQRNFKRVQEKKSNHEIKLVSWDPFKNLP